MLNSKAVARVAEAEMPKADVRIREGALRHNVIDDLSGADNIGIELGVATAIFSERMVRSGKFAQFFGVDSYEDIHDTAEYKSALLKVGLLEPYKLLRMRFDEALDLFPDDFFDFIYVDGYAHTGEEGGETLVSWFRKLKVGGIMAGDDYDDRWPLVQWAVNDLAVKLGAVLNVTDTREDNAYSASPSWFFTKEAAHASVALTSCEKLRSLARDERERLHKARFVTTPYWKFRRAAAGLLEKLGIKDAVRKALLR